MGSKDKKEASFVPSEIPNQNLGTSPDFVLFDFGRDNFGRGVARAVYLLVSQSVFLAVSSVPTPRGGDWVIPGARAIEAF